MDNTNEINGVIKSLSTAKIVTFKQFVDYLNKLINEENKRIFKCTSDTGSYVNGYIYDFELSKDMCKLKVRALGNQEYYITYVPSIFECITQRQEGIFTLFFENSTQIVSIKE
ncbi:hypothetical protein ACQUY5_31200 [Bacillus cereus]|uniref:hypothetical protein n=1 Tax=Bacillus cereus TaxID=1396 RepID=UPI003D174CE0